MRNVGVVVASFALSGCLESSVVTCEDGRICPEGLVCDEIHDACVLQEQLDTCGLDPDGTPCEIAGMPGGFCQDGVCLRPRCGDGVRAPSEECEPAEDITIDCTDLGYYEVSPLSCGADCKFDTDDCTGGICGDGTVDGPEDCDELVPGTVVADCLDLDYYDPGDVACTTFCRFNDSGCTGSCGDGETNGPELCDGAWESIEECADFGFDAGRIRCSESQCVAAFDGCASIGWRRIVTPATETIVAGWGSSPDDVWAIARQQILHMVDGEWVSVDPGFGLPTGLNVITGTGPDDVWVCGTGVIWHWNGTTWIDESQGTNNIVTIAALAPDDVWAIRKQPIGNALLHRDATGWTNLGSPGLSPTELWAGDGAVWFGTSSGTVAEWNGSDWTFHAGLMTEQVTGIWGSSAHDVWFSGINGTVLHYDGVGWDVGVIPGATLVDLWGSGPADIWVVGDLSLHHSDGHGFRPVDLPAPGESAVSGWSTGPGDTWYSGNSLYRSDGRTWGTTVIDPAAPVGFQQVVVGASATDNVWGIVPTGLNDYTLSRFDGWSWQPITMVGDTSAWVAGPGEAWFGAVDGVVHHDGATVTPHTATGILFTALWGSGPDDVWAAGSPTWRWDGTSFAPIPDDPDAPYSVWGFGPDDVWLGGAAGRVVHYDGATWTDHSVAGAATIASIWGAAPDDVWFASGPALLHWDGAAMSTIDLELGNVEINVVWGTAPDDVWAAGPGIVLHHDGVDWAPVRTPIPLDVGVLAISGTAREITFGISTDHSVRLDRTVPWACRAQETSCGDATDDDCDGLIDGDDPACATAVRLQELFSGDGGFVEVSNQTAARADLTGLELVWQLACDAEPIRFRFPAGSNAAAGASFRVIEGHDVGARERWLDGTICGDSTDSGWALLCAGRCDLAACSNVVDVLAVEGSGVLPPRPACASFAGAPVDVSAAGAGESVTRTAFATSGSSAEWTIVAASRD